MLLGVYGARRWLANPVRDLSATMGRLANGNFSARIANADRRDEIGEMARAVEVFKSNGQRAIMLEQEAESVRGRGEAERARNAEIEKQRAAEMDQATRSLGKGLTHLAKSDLSFTLAEKFAPDFEGLREDFNAAVAQLASTLVAVAAATSLIDAGSQEISRSADDLSRRTEQQAASLEETAALLDEITVNVTNASKRTEDARKIAHEAKEGAHRSSEVVTRAVDAIEKIEGSSRQISSIIGVIDEIAVQTNLLALNAGVEAARAGEAGEGFAVVAQEVRELAQRSAQAAKEIKGLIQASEAQVVNGAALVRETGDSLSVVEGFVSKINQQMDAIMISAKEQSVGLVQVNTAVNEMDQVTQQNAAMVEETNAAGASLAQESGRLRELLTAFSLPGASAAIPSQTARISNPVHYLHKKVATSAGGWSEF